MDIKQQAIDTYIQKYAKAWSIERMSKVDLAIMRLAMYELLYRQDIPVSYTHLDVYKRQPLTLIILQNLG